MALPATDAFTGTTGTALATYSASWTINNGGFTITTNSVRPASSGNESGARWNADTFSANQYAQGVLVALASGSILIGVAVRCDTSSADTYYGYYSADADRQFHKMVAGTWTQFGSDHDSPESSVNDVIRIEANGTTITSKLNGVTTASVTDSAIATGAAGLSAFGTGTGNRLDDWEGGDLGGVAGQPTMRRWGGSINPFGAQRFGRGW